MSQTVIISEELSRPVAEYSHAVRSGPFVLIGAKGATCPAGRVPLGADFAETIGLQSDLTFSNVELVLSRLGAQASDVAQMSVFMTDWRLQPRVDAGLKGYVGTPPAVSYVSSPTFALPELLFEVDATAVPEVRPERLLDNGSVRAAWSGGWLFSATISAPRAADTSAAELADISAQINILLAESGLARANLLRLRVWVEDARDVLTVGAWLDEWRGPRPAVVVAVSLPARSGQRLAADFIACSDPVERVSAADAHWDAHNSMDTVVACARGVAFTAAASDPGPLAGLGKTVERLQAAIDRAGFSMGDVAKVEGVIDDWRAYPEFRREYSRSMADPYPARSLTQAGPRQHGAHVQLSLIAITGGCDQAILLVPPTTQARETE